MLFRFVLGKPYSLPALDRVMNWQGVFEDPIPFREVPIVVQGITVEWHRSGISAAHHYQNHANQLWILLGYPSKLPGVIVILPRTRFGEYLYLVATGLICVSADYDQQGFVRFDVGVPVGRQSIRFISCVLDCSPSSQPSSISNVTALLSICTVFN